jgi:hypothetical protein
MQMVNNSYCTPIFGDKMNTEDALEEHCQAHQDQDER